MTFQANNRLKRGNRFAAHVIVVKSSAQADLPSRIVLGESFAPVCWSKSPVVSFFHVQPCIACTSKPTVCHNTWRTILSYLETSFPGAHAMRMRNDLVRLPQLRTEHAKYFGSAFLTWNSLTSTLKASPSRGCSIYTSSYWPKFLWPRVSVYLSILIICNI